MLRRICALALAGVAWVWLTCLLLLGSGAVSWAVGADQPGDDQAMAVDGGDRVLLAADERQWLRLHDGNIRIGITVIPPQVLQGEQGFEGLSIDYIRLLERKLGCRFELVPFATWNEVIEAAKNRRIDMIFAAQETPERRQYLLFTEAYIDLPNLIVMRKEREGGTALKAMDGWRVATSKGSAVQE
ncbi:MAG: transporter substrate-binding domain-containing protein, partial [Desulfuromonadaceae bacterium]